MRFLLAFTLCFSLALSQNFLETEEYAGLSKPQKAQLEIFLEQDEVTAFLEQFPDWRANVYRQDEEGAVWKVDFYESDEWLGYAHYNTQTSELFDTILPIDLSDTAKETARAAIEALLFSDAEVLARLGNPDDWERDISYDMYDETWTANFWANEQALGINLERQGEEDAYRIDRFFDPTALSAEDEEQDKRHDAINLAQSAEATNIALSGKDNWQAYAEAQGGPIWSVAFELQNQNLITVLVDLEAGEVLETQIR